MVVVSTILAIMATSFVLFAILVCCPLALSYEDGHDASMSYVGRIQDIGKHYAKKIMENESSKRSQDPMNYCFFKFNVEFSRNVGDFFVDQFFAYSQFYDKVNFEKSFFDIVSRSAEDKFYPVAFDMNAFSKNSYKDIDMAAKAGEDSVQRAQQRYFRSLDNFYSCINKCS